MTPNAVLVTERAAAERWLEERVAQGLRVRDLRELPTEPWDLHDRGWATVAEPVGTDDVAATVTAVLRGVAVAVVAPADRAVAELTGDELGRVLGKGGAAATVASDPGAGSTPRNPAAAGLEPETLELLAVLGGGASTAEAAAAVHVSLRTAERRIAAARRALGVRSTAEAVVAVVGARG